MKTGRFSSIITLAVAFNCLLGSAAYAAFGFGGDTGKSGLDFNNGYDVNTVMTVSGRVVSSPRTGESGHVFIDIKARGENFSLCLGPRSYWEERDAPLSRGDEVTVKGSVAQGNDGKTYLMVQRLSNRTTGSRVDLRNERGNPAWTGMNGNGMMWNRGGGMMWNRGGGMMRGGGMGGGMMGR